MFIDRDNTEVKIAIIGLGYVGLPLALEFGKKFKTIGYDLNPVRVEQLKNGYDKNNEYKDELLRSSSLLEYTASSDSLKDCNVYIITVPTPITDDKYPDLSPLISASELVGSNLQINDVIIYESTVYPGCTRSKCIPIVEKTSGLTHNRDFFFGFSPERMVPGDINRSVRDIVKVTSGSTPEVAKFINSLYANIVDAGTHMTSTVEEAEASKIIENVQRDVNIALMNQFLQFCVTQNISVTSVLDAAKTKWNFLPFEPGLVGGHCIGVDPYYLIYKAQSDQIDVGLIRSARTINEDMPSFYANQIIKKMILKGIQVNQSRTLVCGVTFKENCADVRNSKVPALVDQLKEYGVVVDIYDPVVVPDSMSQVTSMVEVPKKAGYDCVVFAVGHQIFKELGVSTFEQYTKNNAVWVDLKNVFPKAKMGF